MSVRKAGEHQDFCDHCLTVVKHVGTPKGEFVEISGNENGAKHKAYVAVPETTERHDEAVIICTGTLRGFYPISCTKANLLLLIACWFGLAAHGPWV
jgi:hypothetical protein